MEKVKFSSLSESTPNRFVFVVDMLFQVFPKSATLVEINSPESYVSEKRVLRVFLLECCLMGVCSGAFGKILPS